MSRFSVCVIAVVFLFANPTTEAGIIRLDNSVGGLGRLLDEISIPDLGTAGAGPFVVPGLEPVTISVVGLSAIGTGERLNSTSSSLGINSQGSDATDRFDSRLDEFVLLSFDQSVAIDSLDFTHFDPGESFQLAGVTIGYSDLSNGSTDVFDFAIPLLISANSAFALRANSGSIGIEAFAAEVIATDISTVPEPSTLAIFASLGAGFVSVRSGRRWKRWRMGLGQERTPQRRSPTVAKTSMDRGESDRDS